MVGPTDVLGNSRPSLPPVDVTATGVSSPPTIHTPGAQIETLADDRVACPHCQTLTKLRTCSICGTKVPQPSWRLRADSEIREVAVKILAFRLGGMDDKAIAAHLDIHPTTLKTYMYRAHMNGWLNYNTSKEAIEFGLLPKAIRRLDEALDDETRNEKTGLMVRTLVALKVAEGTGFKDFGPEFGAGTALPQTAISIRIEQPDNPTPIRVGTIGGQVLDVEPCPAPE